ncbi:MAG: hypothetical protein ABIF40_00090 [archaeon]
MKNKLFLLLILLIILTACDLEIPADPFAIEGVTGSGSPTDSIEMEIVIPVSGQTVRSGQQFEPTVVLSNKGDADSYGVVCMNLLDVNLFGETCDCVGYDLFSANDLDLLTEDYFAFGPYTVSAERSSTQDITFSNKFEYETEAVAEVCIIKDTISGDCKTTVGNREKNMLDSNSKGPVRVSKVTESISPATDYDTDFIFTIEISYNPGDGERLYDLTYILDQSCEVPTEMNKVVEVEAELLGEELNCGSYEFDKNNEAVATCTFTGITVVDSQGTQVITEEEQDLTINLRYAYQKTEGLQFQVVA